GVRPPRGSSSPPITPCVVQTDGREPGEDQRTGDDQRDGHASPRILASAAAASVPNRPYCDSSAAGSSPRLNASTRPCPSRAYGSLHSPSSSVSSSSTSSMSSTPSAVRSRRAITSGGTFPVASASLIAFTASSTDAVDRSASRNGSQAGHRRAPRNRSA